MEAVVNDKQERRPCHHIWVHFLIRASRLEPWDESHGDDECIEDVHGDEVEFGSFAQSATLDSWQIAQNQPKTQEVEVVGQ